jgi:ABC-type maltose transport system permease subunit
MILTAGILSLVSSIVLATSGADTFYALMEQSAAQQGQELPPGTLEGMQGGLVVASVVGGLISLGLYALVAFPVRKGKNWARILGTVFAAFSLLGLLGGSFMFGALYGILQPITILLGIAAMVLLYMPGAAPYFQKNQPFANPYGQAGNPYGR